MQFDKLTERITDELLILKDAINSDRQLYKLKKDILIDYITHNNDAKQYICDMSEINHICINELIMSKISSYLINIYGMLIFIKGDIDTLNFIKIRINQSIYDLDISTEYMLNFRSILLSYDVDENNILIKNTETNYFQNRNNFLSQKIKPFDETIQECVEKFNNKITKALERAKKRTINFLKYIFSKFMTLDLDDTKCEEIINISETLAVSWHKTDYLNKIMETIGCNKCNSSECKEDCFLKNKIKHEKGYQIYIEHKVMKNMKYLVL